MTTSTSLPSDTSKLVVQQITLTSGPWTITAKAFVVDLTSPESDFFRCQLYNSTTGKQLDVSAAFVSYNWPGNMITNLAKLKVASGTTVSIQQRCWHDHNGIANAYLDPGSTVLAFKANPSNTNRLSRTSAATSVSQAPASTTVATLGIGVGNWLFGFKATAVNATSQIDDVFCGLSDGNATRASVSSDPNYAAAATFVAFGLYSALDPTTLTVDCRSTLSVSYLDPGAVLWARQVGPATHGSTCGSLTRYSVVDVGRDGRPYEQLRHRIRHRRLTGWGRHRWRGFVGGARRGAGLRCCSRFERVHPMSGNGRDRQQTARCTRDCVGRIHKRGAMERHDVPGQAHRDGRYGGAVPLWPR